MSNKRPHEDNHHHHNQHGNSKHNNYNHQPHRGAKAQKTQHVQQNGKDAGRNHTNGTMPHQNNHSHSSSTTAMTTITPTIVPVSVLDAKFPQTTQLPPVPSYHASSSTTPKSNTIDTTTLPPLPPLPPGPLSDAPFTHPSVVDSKHTSNTNNTASSNNYERLEFLGDAYLELIATRLIYSRFPHLPCGRQAQLREKLIKNSTLASFARAYGFGERVRWSGLAMEAVKVRGGWEKVEADVFEAYVAAVVEAWPEDGGKGFRMVEAWLTALWAGILVSNDVVAGVGRGVVNRKDELARLVGGRDAQIAYEEIPAEDAAARRDLLAKHGAQAVRMGVFLTGWGRKRLLLGTGVGIGKKEAGMLAVEDALEGERRVVVEEIAKVKRREAEARRVEAAEAAAKEEAAARREGGLDRKEVEGDKGESD